MRSLITLSLLVFCAGCAGPGGTVTVFDKAICSPNPKAETVFHDPGFTVRGKTRRDQQWISGTQEAGIRACGWQRPRPPAAAPHRTHILKPRPKPVAAPTTVAPTPSTTTVEPDEPETRVVPDLTPQEQKAKKKHFWQRWQKSKDGG